MKALLLRRLSLVKLHVFLSASKRQSHHRAWGTKRLFQLLRWSLGEHHVGRSQRFHVHPIFRRDPSPAGCPPLTADNPTARCNHCLLQPSLQFWVSWNRQERLHGKLSILSPFLRSTRTSALLFHAPTGHGTGVILLLTSDGRKKFLTFIQPIWRKLSVSHLAECSTAH